MMRSNTTAREEDDSLFAVCGEPLISLNVANRHEYYLSFIPFSQQKKKEKHCVSINHYDSYLDSIPTVPRLPHSTVCTLHLFRFLETADSEAARHTTLEYGIVG